MLKSASITTVVLLGAGLCLAQNGNLPAQTTQPSTRSGSAQSTTQSDTRPSNGQTGSSIRDTITPADQQIRPDFSADQTGDNAAGGGQVTSGTVIPASLDLLLSSKTSQIGDRFTASIAKPIKGLDGSVLIPTGTKLEGVVTNVDQSQLESSLVPGTTKLEFRFTRMVLPNGATAPINVTLDSIKAAEQKGKAKADSSDTGESKPTAGLQEIGTRGVNIEASGSAADSPLKGLSVSAAPGGGTVQATEASLVDLPPQTVLMLRVQHNTMVPASGLR